MNKLVAADSLDSIRIEVIGEGRAVTAPASVWLEWRENGKPEAIAAALAAARREERERCAKIVDDWPPGNWTPAWTSACRHIAARIRTPPGDVT